ncbi:restriction endonuclease subunit R [Sporosarcina sp. P37]|uniref:DEAD/DEAH box helicase family protein n=1 Tax=unclassified Sporosarcina TaxID=2647733 RepID=UPI000A17CC81|nr:MULTISPECIES: DEAD/DEAH box helicase family protein [unclassified Sporosarcina]ARK25597.1 restriction endonuclease subunit R [Sporosarcina sp. P37]PID17313.1 restriction endonuclease subunit R [Sporosarcina sp. P35]
MSREILHAQIEDEFSRIFVTPPDIPQYVPDNLNHELRLYQEQALRHFMFTQQSDAADIAFNHQLFHMATGSGKTLVLAASILYLYKEHGYRNFLFFADSDAIVKKTIDNLTNSASPKYLFNPLGIVIEGETVQIKTVDVFPHQPASNTIYLQVTSIQKLHGNLDEPKENGLTYVTLEDLNIVMLADEAHHYFAETRRNQKRVSKQEAEARSWERTIERLLSLNPKNRLLGFSATFNLDNELLFEKLQNRIVYQYDLTRFMGSGYSKNVVLLQANEDDQQKILNAVLLSQYRKYIARDNGIDLKPIILFKSNTIAKSLATNHVFTDMIENLTTRQLEEAIDKGISLYASTKSILGKMFNYYKGLELATLIRDLQWDFADETILNANDSKFLSEENTLLLNTLEEQDNPIRTIFAVAKLNEGWDVLNLFDIVRISEGASKTRNTTDSEAQLIGRGARYYPFIYEGEKSYQRRFDMADSDLKVIEMLHYHTINENAYIQNLYKSLEAAKIQIKEDGSTRLEAKIKSKFKLTDLYKYGKIYINRVISTTPDEYQAFEDYNVSSDFEMDYETTVEKVYGTNREVMSSRTHVIEMTVDRRLLQKAIQRNPFYHFCNLKKYIPSISSIDEFIENENFLGGLKITLIVPIGLTAKDLTPTEKLKTVEKFLSQAANSIRLNYMKLKGTPVFYGVQFSELIKDYYVEVNQVRGRVNTMHEVVQERTMRDLDWYIYDKAIVNGLERDLIDFINNYIETLQEKYEEVYLIRNERKVRVTEIGGIRGFMPDFLLYLKDENFTYQVFLEPKNSKLHEADQWKENFLLELTTRDDIEVLSENENMRLIGIKFYSDDEEKRRNFKEDFKEKLIDLPST